MAVHKTVSMKEFRKSIRQQADDIEKERKDRLKKYGVDSKHYQYIIGFGWALEWARNASRTVRLATFKKSLQSKLDVELRIELGFARQYGVDSVEAWREKGQIHGLQTIRNLVDFYQTGRV